MDNNQVTIEELLFCHKFEIDTIADYVFRNSLERWVPGFCNDRINKHHEDRYLLASKFVKDKTVLDVACGSGFGSKILTKKGVAKSVTGYDISPDSIKYALIKHRRSGIDFQQQNAETFAQPDKFYDVIVSFETIEHLKNHKQFIQQVKQSLTTDGLFIVSTPISKKRTNLNPTNPYHVIEWKFADFQEYMKEHFQIKETLIQTYRTAEKPGLEKLIRKLAKKERLIIQEIKAYDPATDQKYLKKGGYQILICSPKK